MIAPEWGWEAKHGYCQHGRSCRSRQHAIDAARNKIASNVDDGGKQIVRVGIIQEIDLASSLEIVHDLSDRLQHIRLVRVKDDDDRHASNTMFIPDKKEEAAEELARILILWTAKYTHWAAWKFGDDSEEVVIDCGPR